MYQAFGGLDSPNGSWMTWWARSILGPGAVLRRLIDSEYSKPDLLWPSGTGKTTVANIIAQQTRRKLYRLNATTASTSDIKDIVAQLDTLMARIGYCCTWMKIQSFNKSSSSPCWSTLKRKKLPSLPLPQRIPIFTFSTPF